MAKQPQIARLNSTIRSLKEQGWTYPTEYGYMGQAHARIIVPVGMKDSGTIRSFEQVNNALERQYKDKAILMTKAEYNREVKELYDELSGNTNKRDFLKNQRADMIDIVREAQDFTLQKLRPQNISTTTLRNAIRKAGEMARSDSRGSLSFYFYLMDLLGGWG